MAGNGVVSAPFWPDGTPGRPVLAAGLIEALGGTGSFPCWISEARCATAGGSAGPVAAGIAPPCPGAPIAPGRLRWRLPAPGPNAPGCGGRLITVLITVVLWMLAKMTLFGGGLT